MIKSIILLLSLLSVSTAYAAPNRGCIAALGEAKRAITSPFLEKAKAKKGIIEIVGDSYAGEKVQRVDNLISGAVDINISREKKNNNIITEASFEKNPTRYQRGWAAYLVPVSLVDAVETSIKTPKKLYSFYKSKHIQPQLVQVLKLYKKEMQNIIIEYVSGNPELRDLMIEKTGYSNISNLIDRMGHDRIVSLMKELNLDSELEALYKEKSNLRKRITQYRKRESNIITVDGVKYYPAGPYSQGSEIPVVKVKDSYWNSQIEEGLFAVSESLEFLDQKKLSDSLEMSSDEQAAANNNNEIMKNFKLGDQVKLNHDNKFIMGRFRGFWKNNDIRSRGLVFDSSGIATAIESLGYTDLFKDDESIFYRHSQIEYGSTIVFIEKVNPKDGSSKVLPIVIEHGMELDLIH